MKQYSFSLPRSVSTSTTEETKSNPIFTTPSNPTVSCTMDAIEAGKDAYIKCIITSYIEKHDIILAELTASGFNDVVLDESISKIASEVTCEGTKDDSKSDDSKSNDSKSDDASISFFYFF